MMPVLPLHVAAALLLFWMLLLPVYGDELVTYTASGQSPYTAQTETVGPFSTYQAACQALASKFGYKLTQVTSADASGDCKGTRGPDGQIWHIGTWVRHVEQCPGGVAESGLSCMPRDCSNLSPGIFKSPSGPIINYGGRNYVSTSFPLGSSVCFGGCSYSIDNTASSCYKDIGSADTGYCNHIGTGTGDSCNEPDAPLGAPGDVLNPPDTPDVPPSDPNDPGCPPGYGWSGTTCAKNPDDNGNPPGGDTGGGDNGGDDGGNSGGGNSGGGDSGGGDSGGGNNGDGDGSGNGDGDGNGSGSGNTGGGSGNGNGNGDGDGEGEGEGSGPGFCDGDDCAFVAPSYFGGAEKIPGFDESFQRVYDGVLNSPIGSAVTGIAFPSGDGVCPSGSVKLFGQNVVFDGHCTLWPQISGIFTALMIAVWSLLAVRIVLSS
ncbi:methyltransferase [Pseudomonas sp. NCCP-436]|uniref:methyltransferase n=1 Tax=Pseudomonas sp. NCCP-436 TaxID=2842481 RepID=UPI001D75D3C5|nr:methyltransferase [Pseudomonas sp. NCCP-436]GIZ13430.1 hypothetical protein NCCP436_28460 [Pseudomonas sp. NCCP-436]